MTKYSYLLDHPGGHNPSRGVAFNCEVAAASPILYITGYDLIPLLDFPKNPAPPYEMRRVMRVCPLNLHVPLYVLPHARPSRTRP